MVIRQKKRTASSRKEGSTSTEEDIQGRISEEAEDKADSESGRQWGGEVERRENSEKSH